MIHFILAALCLALAGLTNGVCDTLQFHFGSSKLSQKKNRLFWDPKQSWRNKYKNGDPDQGPRFPLSTTLLVWTTDAWHLFKMFQLACVRASIVLCASYHITIGYTGWQNALAWLAIWILLIFVRSAGFHLTYTVWLPRR